MCSTVWAFAIWLYIGLATYHGWEKLRYITLITKRDNSWKLNVVIFRKTKQSQL